MNFKEIADNYSKNKRSMMTDAVIKNKNHQRNFPTYHADSLYLMFAEWHLMFPKQKQSIKCTSCRSAVCQFWERMVDEWIDMEQTPKKTSKKKNVPKKNKTK